MTGASTFLRVMLVAVGLAAIVGCAQDRTAVIRYQHAFSFGAGVDPNGNVLHATPGHFFALYHVVCIKNKGADAGTSKAFLGRMILELPGAWGTHQPRYLNDQSFGQESVLMQHDGLKNFGVSHLDQGALAAAQPYYPPNADPCVDPPYATGG